MNHASDRGMIPVGTVRVRGTPDHVYHHHSLVSNSMMSPTELRIAIERMNVQSGQ